MIDQEQKRNNNRIAHENYERIYNRIDELADSRAVNNFKDYIEWMREVIAIFEDIMRPKSMVGYQNQLLAKHYRATTGRDCISGYTRDYAIGQEAARRTANDALEQFASQLLLDKELVNYLNALTNFDWWYDYSDDGSVYRAGVEGEAKLKKIAEENGPLYQIFFAMHRDARRTRDVSRVLLGYKVEGMVIKLVYKDDQPTPPQE